MGGVNLLYDKGWRESLYLEQLNILAGLQDCHDDAKGDFVSEFKSNVAFYLEQYKDACDD